MPEYNNQEPAHLQENDWSCSQDSAEWMLWAYGRRPSDNWMETTMMQDGIISPDDGLLDSSGAALARWITEQYGEFGYLATNDPSVSFDDVANEASEGKHPLMIGGRRWCHWVGVRGYSADDDELQLANPAPGYMGVRQTLNRQDWARLGPFSMVRLTHPASEV